MSRGFVFDAKTAIKLQKLIASRVSVEKLDKKPEIIAGVDASYSRKREVGVGAAVAYDADSLRIIDKVYTVVRVRIPYIPGLLAFREIPCIASAISMLSVEPDVTLVNGHGVAHPREAGLACHLGVALNIRCIGVARRRLVGEEIESNGRRLVLYKNKVVAEVLSRGKNKIYVSVGNRISLDEAVEIVRRVWVKGILPDPLREADELSRRVRRELVS